MILTTLFLNLLPRKFGKTEEEDVERPPPHPLGGYSAIKRAQAALPRYIASSPDIRDNQALLLLLY